MEKKEVRKSRLERFYVNFTINNFFLKALRELPALICRNWMQFKEIYV